MLSLFQNDERSAPRVGPTTGLSIAVHALVLGLIAFGTLRVHRAVIFQPMTRGSSVSVARIDLSSGVMAAALAPKKSTPNDKTLAIRPHPVPRPSVLQAKPAPALPADEPQSSGAQATAGKSNPGVTGSGSDTQSMYPAYPTISPSPEVKDRSLLPSTDQKIVVDVNLSAAGQVEEAKLVSGLGNALDQVVLDTVRGWQFHPAMLNGGPIPSSIELVFPFNRNYPVMD